MITQGLGGMRLSRLTVRDCDRFLQEAANGAFGAPLATEQLRRLRRQLVRVVGNDHRRGLVNRNVAELAELPQESAKLERRREARAISHSELSRLLGAASGVVEVLIDLSARNGLRPAEARGLRWSRVDLDARTVRVDAQMNRRNEIVRVKTKRAFRTIRVDERSARLLANWRQAQEATRLELARYWSGDQPDLVATTDVGTALFQRNVHRSLARLSGLAGIEPGVAAYDLRHTAITFQVENGHPVERIADWAGTSERMIWDVYRHKLDDVTDLGSID
jgi:integrase